MYNITFSDGSHYISGNDLLDSGWNKIDKCIRSIFYSLEGKKVYLEGFNNYIHLVHHAKILNNTSQILSIEIIAAHPNYNIIITWDFKNKQFTVKKQNPENTIVGFSGWKTGEYKIFPVLKTN